MGFHSWLTGRNDRDEQVFLCRRCGRVSPDDEETEVYWSAYRYGGHGKPEPPE
jgi:ribosomal protein L37E